MDGQAAIGRCDGSDNVEVQESWDREQHQRDVGDVLTECKGECAGSWDEA